MTKYYGDIVFSTIEETSPGIYEEIITKRKYKGDVIKNWRRYDSSEYLNDDINVNNSLSIIADSFLYENLGMMKAVQWMGSYWKISSFEISPPRLVLEIGGIYNGPTDRTSDYSGGDSGN